MVGRKGDSGDLRRLAMVDADVAVGFEEGVVDLVVVSSATIVLVLEDNL